MNRELAGEPSLAAKEVDIDQVDIFLEQNPGNMVRKKAIGIDLSDFE